jgi:hypothetical protein
MAAATDTLAEVVATAEVATAAVEAADTVAATEVTGCPPLDRV